MARIRRDPEARAAEVLRAHGIFNVPIDVGAIAEKLGAEVRYTVLKSDLSGIFVRDKTRTVIGVAMVHPRVSVTRSRMRSAIC
jgi:hypothetical protein